MRADRPRLAAVLDAPWIRADLEQKALALAAATLVPEHYQEVAARRIAHVDKTLAAVHERLSKEIAFWSDRWMKLQEDQRSRQGRAPQPREREAHGHGPRRSPRQPAPRAPGHAARRVGTPVVLGGALVVPVGLLRQLRGEAPDVGFAADPAARSRIEHLAMDAVRRAEEARGCRVVDVSSAEVRLGSHLVSRRRWTASCPRPGTSRSRAA